MKIRSKYRWSFFLLPLLALFLFAAVAAAEDDENVIFKKKTVYNFEDDTITGDLTRPDQEFLSARKGVQHKSLIRVREDFKEKVLQSAGDL
jgi:hypothetical protein